VGFGEEWEVDYANNDQILVEVHGACAELGKNAAGVARLTLVPEGGSCWISTDDVTQSNWKSPSTVLACLL
jgi:hypothetical protein